MGRSDESNSRLHEHCQHLLRQCGEHNIESTDTRVRLKGSDVDSRYGRIPSWALGVGYVLTSLGKVISEDIIESFSVQLRSAVSLIRARFRKRSNITTGVTETSVEIGNSSRDSHDSKNALFVDPTTVDFLKALDATIEFNKAAHELLQQGANTRVYIYNSQRTRLIPLNAPMIDPSTISAISLPPPREILRTILKHDRLPVVPAHVHAIRRLAFDTHTSWSDIVPLIKQDVVLTGNIMKFTNAPRQRTREKIANIQQACQWIGPRHVCGIAFGLALRPQAAVNCVTFDASRYWATCAARAAAAWRIATEVSGLDPQDAYTAGLLCKIGTLAIAVVFPELFDLIMLKLGNGPLQRYIAIERATLGVDHAEVSAQIIESWHMPSWFVEAIGQHVSPEPTVSTDQARDLSHVIATADIVADIFMREDIDRLSDGIRSVQSHMEKLRIAPHKAEAIFNESIEEWKATCGIYDASSRDVPQWYELIAMA